MLKLKFSRLFLLSQSEQRALRIHFGHKPTVIKGGNQMGKSAIIKSLYNAFGAEPLQIDASWRRARVATAVQFSLGTVEYTMLNVGKSYAVFDQENQILIRTTRVGTDLGRFLAQLLDFRLVMINRNDETVVPPPSYIFAPFYVDQDKGWTNKWSSFDDLYLPNSRRLLDDYHSGLKPNEYYVALAERNRLEAEYKDRAQERIALDHTFRRFKETVSDLTLNYDVEDFEEESAQLVAESTRLHNQQILHRRNLTEIHQTRLLWKNQRDIIASGLREMRGSYRLALQHPPDVECPTCGAHYQNSIAERFALIKGLDGLTAALTMANEKIEDAELAIATEMKRLREIEAMSQRIDHILSLRKAEVTFRDIVTAEGRNEASRIFRARLAEVDDDLGWKRRLVDDQTDRMHRATSKRRSQQINGFFAERLAVFNGILDVRTDDPGRLSMHSAIRARGSELPRALLAYYYAFLHTNAAFSSSAFCPIVIDAPNQQGQDEEHMPAIMRFLVKEAPKESQVVLAAENLFGLHGDDVDIIDVGEAKNQVLRGDEFKGVMDALRPFLGALI